MHLPIYLLIYLWTFSIIYSFIYLFFDNRLHTSILYHVKYLHSLFCPVLSTAQRDTMTTLLPLILLEKVNKNRIIKRRISKHFNKEKSKLRPQALLPYRHLPCLYDSAPRVKLLPSCLSTRAFKLRLRSFLAAWRQVRGRLNKCRLPVPPRDSITLQELNILMRLIRHCWVALLTLNGNYLQGRRNGVCFES